MSNNRVEVHVGAKTSELKKGMNDAESIVHNTARDIEAIGKKIDFDIDVSKVQKSFDTLSNNISSQMLSLGKKIAVGLGSAIAIDGLIDLSKNVVNTASEVNKLSQLVGESVEDFQYFAAGAKTAGLSLDQFGQMGKDALDRLGEARRGEGEMMDFFEKIAPKIGITIDQFKNLSGPDVIQAYYSGLEKANLSHAETITYMEQIVNDGSLLIPLLKDGGAGFKKWGEEAKKAGAIMSKDMVDNLGKVKDNVYMLQLHFQGFQAMLINIVTPVVSAIAQNFDNIKAVVIALGAAISAKLVVQCAVLAKEFVIGIAQGIAYQMQLSALQGQALRTASALGILRNASVLLGGAGGLAMLALQGVAAGAAFLYMKRTSDEVTPSLSIQSKSIAELREEYEKLDKVQQRVLTRKATENLDKASKTYKRQEIALLGAVRALIKHSDASDADKKSVKELYDLYLSGERTVEQLASAINNLRTVEEKHKTGIDEKAASVIKERKAILDAESVLNTYNNTVRQGTKDNREHTNSINDKANALANLTAKQIEYVSESQKQAERERYIQHNMNVNGLSRARAEHMADVRASAGMGYTANTGAMPEAVRQAEAADWKRKQAEAMRQETERKAEKSKYEETKYSDLRIKSTEAYAGGKSHQAILDLAGMIQEKFQIIRFTAFNDKYHQGTNSKHAQGLALDFTLQDEKKSPIISSEIKNLLDKNGINGQVIDEYKSPSARATGGHIHVSFNSQADANKYLGLVKNNEIKAKSSKQTSSDNQYEQFLQKEVEKAEEAEKQKIALQYKYADEQKQIAIDLQNALDVIKKSKLSEEEKQLFSIKAEKDAADKIKEIRIEQLIKIKTLQEEELRGKELIAQRIYELEMAQLQALVNAGKVSNFQKIYLAKQFEDQLYEIKRKGLEERLGIEQELSHLTGNSSNVIGAVNEINTLDHGKALSDVQNPSLISDAEMKDFETKFGDLTSRMSSLWDKGIQSMMNGTLTWKNATDAIYAEMAGAFIQNIITVPMKRYLASMANRLALKLGFIKTETAAEISGQTVQSAAVVAGETTKTLATSSGSLARLAIKASEAIKTIMMYAWEAMAGAFKAMVSIPYIGPFLAVGAGASALALVSGIAGNIKSARGGYDIPTGVNPMTQLHEEEMVLPKQHANTIRALGKAVTSNGSFSLGENNNESSNIHFNIQAFDSKDVRRFLKNHGREMANSLKGYNRNFGK